MLGRIVICLFVIAVVIYCVTPTTNNKVSSVDTKASTGTTDTISLPDTLALVMSRVEFRKQHDTILYLDKQLKATALQRDRALIEIIRLQGIVSDTVKYQSWSDKEHLITRE
jgi:hypothetical protein